MKRSNGFIYVTALLFLLAGCGKPVSVMVITGGHSYDTTEFVDLFHSMADVEFDTAIYPAAMDILSSEQWLKYDVLLFYDFLHQMPQKDSVVFLKLMEQGKSMLFLHHALGTSQLWDGYKQMVGGKYVMPQYGADSTLLSDYRHDIDMMVEVVDPEHPVTWNMSDFEIHDEGYSNVSMVEGVVPLLKTAHPDCSPVVGWTKLSGQSTVVYLMLGHDQLAYANESFQQLLSNSIHWLASEN